MDYRQTEKLIPCPYNSSHQIIPHRMAKHIAKCKKNYPDASMKVCIFNAVHVVPSHQYQAHLMKCDSKELAEQELYQRQMPAQGKVVAVPKVSPSSDPALQAECWEGDLLEASYCPAEHTIYKEFTRPPPPGMSKAARKAWRKKEVERVVRLKNGQPIDDFVADAGTQKLKQEVVGLPKDRTLCGVGAVQKLCRMTEKLGLSNGGEAEEDQPLRHPRIPAEIRRPRIAANIFSPAKPNGAEDGAEASHSSSKPQE